jgi:laminin alpha 1/2
MCSVCRLRDVSMDYAIEPRPSRDGSISVPAWQLARGVEKCECPREYRATSCQNPSIGFYRWLPPSHHIESTIIIQLVGESRPCACASRSETCDPETGACLVSILLVSSHFSNIKIILSIQNCTQNTSGVACDRCGIGYFGDPKTAPCRPCPCPNPHNNRATSCVVGRGEVQCRCQPGYTGARCERYVSQCD